MATDDYYTPIGLDNNRTNKFQLESTTYSWENWTVFLKSNKDESKQLTFQENSLLKDSGVTIFSDILFMQTVPFASFRFKCLKEHLHPWTDFIMQFCSITDSYNKENPKDQIKIIINRVGGLSKRLNKLKYLDTTHVFVRNKQQDLVHNKED